jgi:hypothetical protein
MRNGEVLKGFAAGLVGGLVASWTMNQFQAVWSKATECFEKPDDEPSMQANHAGPGSEQDKENQDDATVKAAKAISEGIFGHDLTEAEKKIAGPVVHYSLGTAVGGFYGAAAEVAPQVTKGAGVPFGAAFWLVVDETAVPLFGFSKGPAKYPLSTHVYALTSHFVYGLTAEVVRRAMRRAL